MKQLGTYMDILYTYLPRNYLIAYCLHFFQSSEWYISQQQHPPNDTARVSHENEDG
jgi:hypothetical protein